MCVSVINQCGVRLPPLPSIRDIVKLYKIRALKKLSQNILMDERLTDKIVKAGGEICRNDVVLEVGPGPGSLTRSILKRGPFQLILVEKDARFMPYLQLLKESANDIGTQVDIHHADILKLNFDYKSLGDRRLHILGNLPFSISTRLLINWLKDMSQRSGAFAKLDTVMTLTFQKEVAERICAPIGHKDRCRLSVMNQIWSVPSLKFHISGKSFVPKPDVDVGVVTIRPLKEPKTTLEFNLVEKVVRHTFSMRQKYCCKGYSTLFPEADRTHITNEVFTSIGIDCKLRPFELSVEEFLLLATAYNRLVTENPEIGLYDYRAPREKIRIV